MKRPKEERLTEKLLCYPSGYRGPATSRAQLTLPALSEKWHGARSRGARPGDPWLTFGVMGQGCVGRGTQESAVATQNSKSLFKQSGHTHAVVHFSGKNCLPLAM